MTLYFLIQPILLYIMNQANKYHHQDPKYLTNTIQIDPYSPSNAKNYRIRSSCYSQVGQTETAIMDLSKSLVLDPNLQTYFRRGKLYASSSMFVYALMDFQQADRIYQQQLISKQSKDHNVDIEECPSDQAIQFLQKSIVVKRLPQIKQIAKKQQKLNNVIPTQLNQQFALLMNQMIEQKMAASNSQQQQKYQKLLQIVQNQQKRIKELQNNIENKTIDYQQVFYKQMEGSTLSDINKDKCMIYYHNVLSELEEYYLAAKILSDIDEKKLKFEDYQQTIKQDTYGITKYYIQKIFKMFEKNHSKLERAGEIVKEIPYIGTAFKLIKSAVKGFSWFQDIKVESQCDNILELRPNVTSFNVFASHLGYQMYRFFKINITTQNPTDYSTVYKRSNWEKIAKGYKNFRKKHIGAKVFKHLTQIEKDYIAEMGQVHASIFMVGVAYGLFKMPHGTVFPSSEYLTQIFHRLAEVEKKLLITIDENEQEKSSTFEMENGKQQQITEGGESKKKVCAMF